MVSWFWLHKTQTPKHNFCDPSGFRNSLIALQPFLRTHWSNRYLTVTHHPTVCRSGSQTNESLQFRPRPASVINSFILVNRVSVARAQEEFVRGLVNATLHQMLPTLRREELSPDDAVLLFMQLSVIQTLLEYSPTCSDFIRNNFYEEFKLVLNLFVLEIELTPAFVQEETHLCACARARVCACVCICKRTFELFEQRFARIQNTYCCKG